LLPRTHCRLPIIWLLLLPLLLAALFGWLALSPVAAEAAPLHTAPLWQQTQPISVTQTADDTACRLCHADTTAVIEFPSGETLPVMVEPAVVDNSAHGVHANTPLSCTACHDPAHYQFPHPPVEEPDLRSYQLSNALTCERCHQDAHLTSHPDPASDSPVTCTDCHGAHDVRPVEDWYEGEEVERCANCHVQAEEGPTDEGLLTELVVNGLFRSRHPDNTYCLACHQEDAFSVTFANGDVLPVTVSADELAHSVHGTDNPWQPLACTDCHEGYLFPHPPVEAADHRDYELEKTTICGDCHQPKEEQALDSVHAEALAEGNLDAAVCTDCHGDHAIPVPNEPRSRIAETCRQCHSTIYDEYADSVHGASLLEEENLDVPTCINCHGVHNIHDPSTTLARIRSPQLCADCHANEELMADYDISTDVFETYVADFHGTTVQLFNNPDPTTEVNEAVCYDCHGVHNIKEPDNPEAGIKANLLVACQQCHPDANTNFPDAWTSHFRPSLEHHPMVFLVNLFYWLIIPATVVGLLFLVGTDVYRRVRLKK
jgi:predicted CXXCH cytochrome family protein